MLTVEDIFLAAVDKALADRGAYLDAVCGADAGLRADVEALLRSHEEAGSVFEQPLFRPRPTLDQPPAAQQPGTSIGPYKLIEQIGEGGMGTVWMAQQIEPVKRLVAVKLIKAGMDSKQVIARFEAERQALALMDHVNIARVLDAGMTGTGRPYFVMDLVKGMPITKYCDEHHLTPRQRLELFIPVCQAIQHAHQKGIIHRDLKPSNVLVAPYDGKPVPKIIDFGVAKAAGQQLTEKTLVTGFGAIVGTLEYMSPEQAEINQLDIDTRSDVYSLGVLLYELLAGSPPFSQQELQKAGMLEMLRVIREHEPAKPSTKLSTAEGLPTLAANRGTEPAKLKKLVRGELDWIVMKALEKDRNRRYETANGFARDVERYLNDEPVVACPASVAYRLRKFVRRNKRVLASAAVLAVAGLVIAGTIGWAVRDRDAHAQEVAREHAARRLVVEQAVGRALEQADELRTQGKWQEALVAAERAEAALVSGEAGAEARQQVGEQLADLRLIQRLDAIRSQEKETEHEHQHGAYASVFADFGIDMESLSPPEVAARIQRRPSTTVRMAAALDDWAILLRDWGLHDPTRDPAIWKRLLEAARLADPDPWRRQLRELMGQEDLNALRNLAQTSDISALPVQSLRLMGTALIFGGDAQACVAWLRRAHRRHPNDALIAFDLFFHLSNLPGADWVEILRFAEAGLAARPTPDMYLWVASALMRLGRVDEAVACYQTVVEIHPNDAKAQGALGYFHARKGQWKKAAASFARAIEVDPKDNWSAVRLGFVLAEQGDLPADQRNCRAMLSRWGKATDPRLADRTAKACLLLPGGVADPAQLAPLVQTGLSVAENDDLYLWILFVRGLHDYRCGRFAEALTTCRNSRQRATPNYFAALLVKDQIVEAMSLFQLGETDESRRALFEAGRLLYTKTPGLDDLGDRWEDWLCCRILLREAEETMHTRWHAIELDPNDVKGHIDLGQIHARQGEWSEAAASLARVVRLDPKDHWSAVQLGYVLAEQGDLPAYQEYCATMLSRWGKVTDPMLAERTAKNCLLLPGGVQDLGQLAPLVQTALSVGDQNWLYLWSRLAQGLLDYRCGRFAEAQTACAAGGERAEFVPLRVADQSVEAMSLFRLSKTDEARRVLAAAGRLLVDKEPTLDRGDLGADWAAWLCCRILLREAEETMGTRWQAIELDLNDANRHIEVGHMCAGQGQWKEAAAAFGRALAIDPTNRDVWNLAATARAALGDLEGYRRTCAQIVQRFGDATDKQTVERCAKVCLLVPDVLSTDDFDRVQKMADRAVAGTENEPLHCYFAMVKGLADYRAGRYPEAIKWTETYAPQVHGNFWDAVKFAVLAMAHCRLEHGNEARAAFDRGQAILAKMPDTSKGQIFGGNWDDWLHAQVLGREAEEMLETDPSASPAQAGRSEID